MLKINKTKPILNIWLSHIYDLIKINKIDDAIDILFSQIDNRLLKGEFKQCDEILKSINLQKVNITFMICVLAITSPAKDKLLYRKELFENIKNIINQKDPQRCSRLLNGLE